MAAPGEEIVPGLKLLRCIGRGATASVWLAERGGERVAVKLLSEEVAKRDKQRRRFGRGTVLARAVNSHHLVQIREHGVTTDGRPFAVMENLEGETLEQRMQGPKLPIAMVRRLVSQLAAALEAMHDAGVVHRDIKPANVFLIGGGESPVLKVIDFGTAFQRTMTPEAPEVTKVTGTGVAVGSPAMMSPEQVLGSRYIDHRTDLWAFAVLVYQALCGLLPFAAPNPSALAFTICIARFVPPSRLGAPPALDAWFARAFQPEKERRFPDARSMATEFARLLDGGHVPPPAREPLEDETTFDGAETQARPSRSEGAAPQPQSWRWAWGLGMTLSLVVGCLALMPWARPARATLAPSPTVAARSHVGVAVTPPAPVASPVVDLDEPEDQLGRLTIICTPGCSDVRVNGRSWGPSPIFNRPAVAGLVNVMLSHPLYKPQRLTVRVVPGEVTTRRLSF